MKVQCRTFYVQIDKDELLILINLAVLILGLLRK
jgi:hypothetical protein